MAGREAIPPGGRWFLPVLLSVTAALKLVLAWAYPAFLTGDDLEIVQAAARYATGLEYQPWGIRSMLHPLLAWPAMKLGFLAGLSSPHWLTLFACLPTILLSTFGIALLYRLALALDWSQAEARVAAFLFAVHWLPLTYGSTPYPRPISTCLLLGAFLLVADRSASPRRAFFAGALSAAAMAVRWSEGLMLAPLLAFAGWRSRGRVRPAALLGGFLVGLCAFVGLLDTWTWGRPFASLIEFVRFSHEPGLWGSRPRAWFWYGTMVLQWAGPVFVLFTAAGARDRRARAPIAIAVSAALLFSLSPLKQLRYLQAAIPFLAMAAALGWSGLRAGGPWMRGLATAALVVAIPLGLERAHSILESKSDAALAAARVISQMRPEPRRLVLEQKWAYGEQLYLGNGVVITELAPRTPLEPGALAASLTGADAVGLYAADTSATITSVLQSAGFQLCETFVRKGSRTVVLYLPVTSACPVTSGSPRS